MMRNLNFNTDILGLGSSKPKRQPVSTNQKNQVLINQRGRCYDCPKILVVTDYHHIKHVSNNGRSTTKNLVALCPECHRKRHIKEQAMKTDKKRTRKASSNNYSQALNNILRI